MEPNPIKYITEHSYDAPAQRPIENSALQKIPDYSQIFYKAIYENERIVFSIPFSLLPHKIPTITLEDIEHSQLSTHERMKATKEKCHGFRVFTVLCIEPLKILGSTKGISNTRFIYEIFKTNPLMSLIHPSTTPLDTHPIQIKSNARLPAGIHTTPIKNTHPILEDLRGEKQENIEVAKKENREIIAQLSLLKKELSAIVNTWGLELSPNEPVRLIWDSLSLLAVQSKIADAEKTQYSQALLEYWESIQWSISSLLSAGATQNYSAADQYITDIYIRLSGFRLFLQSKKIKFNIELCEQIEGLQKPLLNFFSFSRNIQTCSSKNLFYKEFHCFMSSLLSQWCLVEMNIGNLKEQVQRWMTFRLESLEIYLSMNSKAEEYVSKALCQTIKEGVSQENWLLVYEKINQLMNDLHAYCKKNRTREWDTNGFPTITKGKFIDARCVQWIHAILNDFNCIISNQNFHTISQGVLKELRTKNKLLTTTLDLPQIHQAFSAWTLQLEQKGQCILKDYLESMQKTFASLKNIRESIGHSADIQSALQTLFNLIDSKQLSDLNEIYFKTAQKLEHFYHTWKTQLGAINSLIRQMQDLTILLLFDLNLPSLELRHVKLQFEKFNQSTEQLIKPVMIFFNAFHQLISLDPKSLKGLSKQNKNISLCFEDPTFSLCLFQSDDQYFDELTTKIAYLRLQKNEELIVSLEKQAIDESLPPPVNPHPTPIKKQKTLTKPTAPPITLDKSHQLTDFYENVQQVFKETKVRKIFTGIQQLISNYHSTLESAHGKGDHFKLFINDLLIVLPAKKEWKPGTLHSIKKRVEQTLLKANEELNSLQSY